MRTFEVSSKREDLTACTMVSTKDFLSDVFPKHKIEHLGRQTILGVTELRPTSLFFQALLGCFENHYPLALSPDVLAYLINHEVAIAVKRNPEGYRSLFTREPDKQTITIIDDSLVMGSPSNWERTLKCFDPELRKRVPEGIMDKMLPGYSTDTPESVVATLISFMDAASPYYNYRVHTRCGIPSIRLLGTPEDWQKLYTAAEGLSKLFQADLKKYFSQLLPILKKISEQSDPGTLQDTEFWSSIYKFQSMSGGNRITGWITVFVNYVKDINDNLRPKDEFFENTTTLHAVSFATHVSSVPFVWKYYLTEYPMSFLGGVLGIDNEDGFVCPKLSYAVVHGDKP